MSSIPKNSVCEQKREKTPKNTEKVNDKDKEKGIFLVALKYQYPDLNFGPPTKVVGNFTAETLRLPYMFFIYL